MPICSQFVNENGVSEENRKQALCRPDLGEFLWEFQKIQFGSQDAKISS